MNWSYMNNEGQKPKQGGSSGTTASTVSSAAETALALYQAYQAFSDANKQEPGPVPMAGPMDTTPTAMRFGQQKRRQ